jgi:hypothetical protein
MFIHETIFAATCNAKSDIASSAAISMAFSLRMGRSQKQRETRWKSTRREIVSMAHSLLCRNSHPMHLFSFLTLKRMPCEKVSAEWNAVQFFRSLVAQGSFGHNMALCIRNCFERCGKN